MRPTPILFLSDSPSAKTGLARITRDLCGLLVRSPHFRVGTLGLGGNISRHLPWAQYTIDERLGAWGSGDLERIWTDFAGQERGIVMTIWDATRTHWLSRPQYCGDQQLLRFLNDEHFVLWGYFPIDATGPCDRLSSLAADSLLGYNRLLTYTQWADGVVRRTIGETEASRRGLTWIPHGLDFNQWVIRDREEAKRRFFPLVHEGDLLVGAVGTNQARKDWGLVAQVCSKLVADNPKIRAWWHIDMLERYWSVPALLADFGLTNHVTVTTQMTNDELCWAYNACDLTLGHGAGEGFGYALAESLACGTPVLHCDYGGGADWMRQAGWDVFLIPPKACRYDGLHNQVRPVQDHDTWAGIAKDIMDCDCDRERLRRSVEHLAWGKLWEGCWRRWFEGGL
jgi:glycosyltransferase involved in cell wall biosynthesis